DQWPLRGERLKIAQELVLEQLALGHIVPSTSPWNTPIFVIPKKSGKWRLLQDLRVVNAVMSPMGALKPGLPNVTMIPDSCHLLIIDLKDCFFTIFLHSDDCCHFAFSVLLVNNDRSMQRYHWVELPQGMKNRPTICQFVGDSALRTIRDSFPTTLIHHYMDDILIAASSSEETQAVFMAMKPQLELYGLKIASEKVQTQPPWKYLGWKIHTQQVRPQPLRLAGNVKTLNDLQRLFGSTNRIRPLLGITTEQLSPGFNFLKGDPDL
ncbi:hypothetical protein N330_11871, partial [Leptosomus discolor]